VVREGESREFFSVRLKRKGRRRRQCIKSLFSSRKRSNRPEVVKRQARSGREIAGGARYIGKTVDYEKKNRRGGKFLVDRFNGTDLGEGECWR